MEILWLAGNHDCWGGEILRQDVGVDYHIGPWTGDLAGWRSRVEHGDGLRQQEDRGYRVIRPVMRNALAIRAFRALHPDWATRLAQGSSDASREYRARDRSEEHTSELQHGYISYAVFCLKKKKKKKQTIKHK